LKNEMLAIKGIQIHPDLLKEARIQRCAIVECQAACCSGGVWLDPPEHPRILEWAESIKKHIPPERHDTATWFETGDPDPAYPDGYEIGTNSLDDPAVPGKTCCVFLRPDRICALQLVSDQNHLGWPGLKPFFCALYPLYIEDNLLSLDTETPVILEGGGCQRECADARPIYRIYAEETRLVLGDDGYQELCARAQTVKPGRSGTESGRRPMCRI